MIVECAVVPGGAIGRRRRFDPHAPRGVDLARREPESLADPAAAQKAKREGERRRSAGGVKRRQGGHDLVGREKGLTAALRHPHLMPASPVMGGPNCLLGLYSV